MEEGRRGEPNTGGSLLDVREIPTGAAGPEAQPGQGFPQSRTCNPGTSKIHFGMKQMLKLTPKIQLKVMFYKDISQTRFLGKRTFKNLDCLLARLLGSRIRMLLEGISSFQLS